MKLSLIFSLIFSLSSAIGLTGGGSDFERDEKVSIYSPVGKRDPFKPIQNAVTRDPKAPNSAERFNIDQMQLRAILRSGSQVRAMFEDPEGKSHILFQGSVIGRERGIVSRILNTEVIITQRTLNYLGVESLYEKVISLPQK